MSHPVLAADAEAHRVAENIQPSTGPAILAEVEAAAATSETVIGHLLTANAGPRVGLNIIVVSHVSLPCEGAGSTPRLTRPLSLSAPDLGAYTLRRVTFFFAPAFFETFFFLVGVPRFASFGWSFSRWGGGSSIALTVFS